jgi:hypothetical protein
VALVLIGHLKIETPKSLVKINGNIRIDAVTIKRRTAPPRPDRLLEGATDAVVPAQRRMLRADSAYPHPRERGVDRTRKADESPAALAREA